MITSLGIKVSLLHYSLQVLSIMTRPICFMMGTVNMVCDCCWGLLLGLGLPIISPNIFSS